MEERAFRRTLRAARCAVTLAAMHGRVSMVWEWGHINNNMLGTRVGVVTLEKA